MGKITDLATDKLVGIRKTTIDIPHPGRPGMRIIGWEIPDGEINQGLSNLILMELLKNWELCRKFGNR